MKKILFLFALIVMVSCNTKEPVKESTLSGTIENYGDVPVMLYMGNEADTVIVNEDGTYSITKKLDRAMTGSLRMARNYASVYLAPGKNLTANFNAEDLSASIVFEGDLAIENNYSKEFRAFSSELSKGMRDLYLVSPEEFKEGILKIKEAKDDFLNSYAEANADICPDFVEKEKISYEFNYYSGLNSYEPAHKFYAKVEEVELPEGWYDFENDIDLNNAKYLDIPIAANMITTIASKKINEESGLGDEAWGTPDLLGAQFDWTIKNIENQEVKEHLLKSNLLSILDYAGPGGIEEYIDKYYENTTDQKSVEEIKDKVDIWAPMAAGNDAPGFTLPDIDGNEVSLSDFAGKYVYIDFWATWCGPCKIEIPVLGELAVKYADKNIEIISISVDQDKDAWIKMVTEDKPGWLQLHDGVNMNDDYLVRFIPTFVLIDREGKILNARAPRPSSGEVLEELLNGLEGI